MVMQLCDAAVDGADPEDAVDVANQALGAIADADGRGSGSGGEVDDGEVAVLHVVAARVSQVAVEPAT